MTLDIGSLVARDNSLGAGEGWDAFDVVSNEVQTRLESRG